jgi:chemotaxis protein methyltransferase CheR
MNVEDFNFISQLLYRRSGLVLNQEKAYLLESRLSPVARKWNFGGFEELISTIISGADEPLLNAVTEAMTTNESFFFRDQKPFDQFRDVVMPHLLDSRAAARKIRIWSAACSCGQEAYSLAMILSEMSGLLAGWQIEILATDLSNETLTKARQGLYSQFEVQRGLPINLLMKYFVQEGEKWKIKDSLREMVTFQRFNLLTDPKPLGKFDVVFCRNVLIYFDQDTKARVLQALSTVMPEDGFLYLGGAETVLGISERFQIYPGHRGIYAPAPETAQPTRAVI